MGVLDRFLCICPFKFPFSDVRQNPVKLEARIAQLQNHFLIADITVAAFDISWIHGILQHYQWGQEHRILQSLAVYSILYSIGMDAVLGFTLRNINWGFWFFRFISDTRVSWVLPHILVICRSEMWDRNLNKGKTQNQTHLSLCFNPSVLWWLSLCVCVSLWNLAFTVGLFSVTVCCVTNCYS